MRLLRFSGIFFCILIVACDGISFTDQDEWGSSPGSSLFIAINRNDVKLVENILNSGFNVNDVIGNRYGDQPLHVAAYYGRYEIAQLLIKRGADVNAVMPDSNARTPLLRAIWKKHYDVAVLILNSGADPLIPTLAGESACEFAKRNQRTEILSHLPNCH